MTTITHREYVTWIEWLDQQWNVPNRSDYLLMRIAQRVQQVLAGKQAKNITLEDQAVKFERKKRLSPEEEIRQKTAISKSFWTSLVGRAEGKRPS